MELTKHLEKYTSTIEISGDVDSISCGRILSGALKESHKSHKIRIDISRVSYVSSAFVDSLIKFCKVEGYPTQDIVLLKPAENVYEMLTIVNADQIFTVLEIPVSKPSGVFI